jgi:hypothetical protein
VLLDQVPGRQGRRLLDGASFDGDLEQIDGLDQRRRRR